MFRPLRIGLMLRAIAEKGGVGVYTRYLAEELLAMDRQNEYVLFYPDASYVGRFAHYPNVTERVVTAPHKALWDQVAVPYWCWKERVDVVFHPKFTVPLLAPCKSIMVLHGAGWIMDEFKQFWNKLDVQYIRLFMPLYCRRASAILSVSHLTTETFNRVIGVPEGKIRTVYFAPGKHFRRVTNNERLQHVKDKYQLPDRFILTLSRYDGGARKNIGGVLEAFKLLHGSTPHKLVVGGKNCDRFAADFALPPDGYGADIVFPGWIDQEDLPAVYSLADLYVYPSRLEAFPIPITEAMACGTPIVTADANGLKEIAGEAALFVDADKPQAIRDAMHRVLTVPAVAEQLSQAGRTRSALFSWERCARETLEAIESVGNLGRAFAAR
jgi:glycosyltransferase involved in cell wall biosynthesis